MTPLHRKLSKGQKVLQEVHLSAKCPRLPQVQQGGPLLTFPFPLPLPGTEVLELDPEPVLTRNRSTSSFFTKVTKVVSFSFSLCVKVPVCSLPFAFPQSFQQSQLLLGTRTFSFVLTFTCNLSCPWAQVLAECDEN